MAKQAIYYEEAKRLYVNEGLSLDAIVGIFNNKVSRKTLYNWKIKGDWDTKRRNYLKSTEDLQKQLTKLAQIALKEALANPTPHNVYAVTKAVAALKQYQGVKLLEDETTPKQRKGLTKEIVKQIEREVLGLE
jgi:hypothetical protein